MSEELEEDHLGRLLLYELYHPTCGNATPSQLATPYESPVKSMPETGGKQVGRRRTPQTRGAGSIIAARGSGQQRCLFFP
jgi:hypothetical protein